MKLPQGPAAYGATIRPEQSTQKANPAQQSSAASGQTQGDDAARVVFSGASTESLRSASGGAIPQNKTILTSRQNALGAYAKSAQQSNPFAATVASFKTPPPEAPAPQTPAPQAQAPQAAAAVAAQQVTRQTPPQTVSQPLQAATQRPVVANQSAPPKSAPASTSRSAREIDDDDYEIPKPTVDPKIQALAERYVTNYTRQTGKQLDTQERKKMTDDVAKFYGAPSRVGRLEALVSTQEEPGARAGA